MSSPLPDDISNVTPAKPPGAVTPGKEDQGQPGQSFQDVMGQKQGGSSPVQAQAPSPMDVAGQGQKGPGVPPTMDSVEQQMNSTSSVLGDVQNQLGTKNLKLKPSQKYLLRNKLNEANSQIRAAAGKTGAELPPHPTGLSRKNPIAKFLALVQDGQNSMHNAAAKIRELKASGKPLNAGELLLVQVKLNKAQQELEYSSVLLSKAVDDIKTLFNIQI